MGLGHTGTIIIGLGHNVTGSQWDWVIISRPAKQGGGGTDEGTQWRSALWSGCLLSLTP